MRLEGRKALVTGGSSGIGRAIAAAFAREGADVAFTYRAREKESRALLAEIEATGRTGVALRVDFEDLSALEGAFQEAVAALGALDTLVNNAGAITRTPFQELSLEEVERIVRVDFTAPFVLTQLFCRHRLAEGGPGSIVNVSSVSASRAISRMAHYQSAKAALSMLTRSVAYEMAEHGIRANTISPGLTATGANSDQWQNDPDLWQQRAQPIPLGRAGVPEDHVGAAVYLASDESAWVTGAELVIDGGQSTI